jgi:L-histidine Nalpha-methyltransferase
VAIDDASLDDGAQRSGVELVAIQPPADDLLGEVLHGLSQPRKHLPCKLFYDERGSRLFDRICELDEYYLTRTELAIMRRHAAEMARRIGPRARLIEFGSGSSVKIRLLLDHLKEPAGYLPIDISTRHLLAAAQAIARDYPELAVQPIGADYTQPLALPAAPAHALRDVAYFPGSTIGNLDRRQAVEFLRRTAALVGARGGLLVGADLVKDKAILERAYNDAAGVTAEFNLNLLRAINRAFGADFALDGFSHEAVYDDAESRIEMHLISRRAQSVHVAEQRFQLREGEPIVTEYSHKYTLPAFASLAQDGDMRVARVWTDPERLFSVQYLEVRHG